MTYAITGATGHLGGLVIDHLLQLKVPAAAIVAIARNPEKAAGLKAKGVQVRIAAYDDPAALDKALAGVDRLLLVSGSEVGQRASQHQNIIQAAKAAKVKLVAYTSIAHCDTSTNILAPEHQATEAALRNSGLDHVLLRNNWYLENYVQDLAYARQSGVLAAAIKTGKVAAALRTEYAEAAARVLTREHQAGKVYELGASRAWDFNELAKAASEAFGRPVAFVSVSAEARKAGFVQAGLPEGIADFLTGLDTSTESGSLAQAGTDLENLLGRPPLALKEALASLGI